MKNPTIAKGRPKKADRPVTQRRGDDVPTPRRKNHNDASGSSVSSMSYFPSIADIPNDPTADALSPPYRDGGKP
jgi:hypothetical protein